MPRGGIAIGDQILDLRAAHEAGLIDCAAAAGGTLNTFLAQGPAARQALRLAVSALLAEGAPERPELLQRAADCTMHLPAQVGDYSDLYGGIYHATNVGRLFRPENPLLPNYKWLPVGYHGRASSLRVSGSDVRRPNGQRKYPDQPAPSFGPCERLDYELELAVWVGPGNELGTPVPMREAAAHIAGYGLLNDWSARDLQAWEYQPLGPFLAKSFQTTLSPWIITPEALAPFRAPAMLRPPGDPAPLEHLHDERDQREGLLDLVLEVFIRTDMMRARGLPAHRLSLGNAQNLYWTPAQLIAHQASNGCNLNPGDVLGSGTISSPEPEGYGSLLEIAQGGRAPVRLPSGEQRSFLEDGDEIMLQARAVRPGFASIGFGPCCGRVIPAPAL
jgi:fumarylacetoacetase